MQYRNIVRILRHIAAILYQHCNNIWMSAFYNILFSYCHNIVEQYIRRINVAISHSIVMLPEYCYSIAIRYQEAW